MYRMILKLFIGTALVVGLFFLYIKHLEAKSIFFPTKNIETIPSDIGLAFKDIYLKTSDNVSIHGWFLPYENAHYTMLFCHGNGGNISGRLDKILLLRQAKVNIFIIDYRGYGKSSGKPSESGVYLDAKAAYDYLLNNYNVSAKKIILYGESLGGAVAIDLASYAEVGALIVEGTFSTGKDMGKVLYPYLPKFIFPNLFDSLAKVEKINAPKLFFHSKNDEVVPFELGKKLYMSAPQPKEFIAAKGGHNSAFMDSGEKHITVILEFIEKL